MFSKINLVTLVAVLAVVTATPQPTNIARGVIPGPLVGEEGIIDSAVYPKHAGAISVANAFRTEAPAPTLAPRAANPLTFNIVNSFGADIYTVHNRNADAPPAVSGNVGPGVIPAGATVAFAVPSGWAGNVAFVQNGGGRAIVGDESLIEGSYVSQGGSAAPIIDIDVSYVTGFSVQLVCGCDGLGVVTGCNKNLWALHTCGNDNRVGSCKNPQRNANTADAVPDAFFAPCQHQAFTVPQDSGANANNICQSGVVNCCIGAACPAHR